MKRPPVPKTRETLDVDPAVLTERQLDALEAVIRAGCDAAAEALSDLIGGASVDLDVVEVGAVQASEVEARLGAETTPLWGVRLELTGGVDGALLLAYAEDDARRLSALLAGEAATSEEGAFTDVGTSALAELGNILASAYLSAVGTATGLVLLPSVPEVVSGDAAALATTFGQGSTLGERLLLLETRLSAPGPPPLCGHLLIAAHPRGVGTLLGALGL